MQRLTEKTKKKIVKAHIQDGRTVASLSAEYGASTAAINNWIPKYREECQNNDDAKNEYELMLENRNLKMKLEELEKENQFLKKAAAFFAKGND